MKPADLVRSTRAALGLSAEGFARAVHAASGRTVRRWEATDSDVPGSVVVLCRLWTSGRLPAVLVPSKTRPDVTPDERRAGAGR